MSRTFASILLLGLAGAMILPTAGVAQLQSVDEALELSRVTGRPIFAMAGNKT